MFTVDAFIIQMSEVLVGLFLTLNYENLPINFVCVYYLIFGIKIWTCLFSGDEDKCLDILKKAQNLKCEPTQMVETAMERFNKGLSSLQADNEFTIPFSDHTKEQNTSESRSFYTGVSVTQSASKIKRLNTLSTPDCKSLPVPVSASVGASARGKIR